MVKLKDTMTGNCKKGSVHKKLNERTKGTR